MGTQADPEEILVSRTGTPIAGQTDGVGVLRDLTDDESHDGLMAIANGRPSKVLDHSLLCEVFEDFIGGGLNTTDSRWRVGDTSSSGSPTAAISADADNGQFEMTLDSSDEAEILTLYWGDEQNIDSDQGPVFRTRLQAAVLPSAAGEIAVWGLASALNTTEDSVANHAWFRIEANGSLLVESDDGTTDNNDKDTDVDLTAATFYEFEVDATNPLDVKFRYRAALGGDWTDLTPAGTTFKLGADVQVQPYIQLSKDSGAGVPSLLVDYVYVYWKRN